MVITSLGSRRLAQNLDSPGSRIAGMATMYCLWVQEGSGFSHTPKCVIHDQRVDLRCCCHVIKEGPTQKDTERPGPHLTPWRCHHD